MTFFGSLDYTVSKHGVAGLNQHLAWELADSHITVNTICPGGVLTPSWKKVRRLSSGTHWSNDWFLWTFLQHRRNRRGRELPRQ